MVGGQTTILPSNPVTLGNSLGTLANALRTNDIDRQNRQNTANDQQAAAQKYQDELDMKRAQDAMNLINSQKTEAGKLAVRNYILNSNPHLSRFMVGADSMPMDEATQQSDMQTTNAAHVGRDASALVRDQYENPNAAPAPSRALIDAHLPGTTAASPKDQFEAQDRDTVAGGANPLGSPAVAGVAVPSRNPLADTLRGGSGAAAPPTAPAATPTAPPAVVRPPMPVNTDGHTTAGTMTGGALHRMFAGDLSVEPEASRGPGAVPAAAAANADQGSAPVSAPAAAADYMQGVVPAKPPNPAQMEATRQRQGLDLNAEQQSGAADKVGSLNATVARDKATAAHQQREDASMGDLRNAQAAEVRQKTADAKNAASVSAVRLAADGTPDASGASALVQAALKLNYDPATLQRRFKPAEQEAFQKEMQQYSPGWSWGDYAKRWKVKQNFASGKDADTVRSANQFIGHVGSLVDAHDHMHNQNTTFTNAIGNFLQTEVPGAVNPEIQKAGGKINTEAHGVGTEFTKFMRGAGVVPEKEVLMSMNGLTPNTPPAKLQGAVEGMLEMGATALEKLKEKYVNGVGSDAGFKENVADKIISPDVVNTIAKLKTKGYDVSHFEDVIREIQTGRLSGGGSSASIPSPAPAAAPTYAHTATGPNGHKIGSNDGNKWFDMQTGQPVN